MIMMLMDGKVGKNSIKIRLKINVCLIIIELKSNLKSICFDWFVDARTCIQLKWITAGQWTQQVVYSVAFIVTKRKAWTTCSIHLVIQKSMWI